MNKFTVISDHLHKNNSPRKNKEGEIVKSVWVSVNWVHIKYKNGLEYHFLQSPNSTQKTTKLS